MYKMLMIGCSHASYSAAPDDCEPATDDMIKFGITVFGSLTAGHAHTVREMLLYLVREIS